MPIPDFQTLMLPLLRFSSNKEWRNSEAVEQLAGEFRLTDEEQSALNPSGYQTTFYNRVAWAKFYLSKAGLVAPTVKQKFSITDMDREVLRNPPDRITVKYLNQSPAFQEFRKSNEHEGDKKAEQSTVTNDDDLPPDENNNNVYLQLEQELEEELIV